MALPENVVVDTSAFYTLVSETDEFHSDAVLAYESLMERDLGLWTTSYALVETIALVHRRLGFDTLSQLLSIIDSNVQIFWVESAIHSIAMREFTSSVGRGLSLVDWTIVLAARVKSAHVFTFDGGIVNRGLTVVPRQ